MNYNELKTIVNKRIVNTSDNLPQDSLQMTSQLNLRLKNSIQCKEDCKDGQYLLEHCNACYCIFKGEYTIYYDEKYPYKNFSIAHEIAHHLLGHTSDGSVQHHDAQLMAAIIVAPAELIHKHDIKSAIELAETCKIPIEVAENYWFELEDNEENFHLNSQNDKKNDTKNFHKIDKIALLRIGIFTILAAILILMTVQQYTSTNNTVVFTQDSTPTPTLATTISPTIIPSNSAETQTVFVTPTGEKYHIRDCKHIKNSTNLLELSIDEAVHAGYEPCKDCIR